MAKTMRLGGMMVSVLVALVVPARADEASEALALVDRGVQLYKANDLANARIAFAAAQQLVPDKANPYRWLGLVDARLGRCGEAVEELTRFLGMVPAGDPRALEALAIRDACNRDLIPKLGVVVIESTPPGAVVKIDETAEGVTPWRGNLRVGSHVVELSRPGFHGAMKSVGVTLGGEIRLDVTLQPEVVAVTPAASPAPAPALDPAAQRKLDAQRVRLCRNGTGWWFCDAKGAVTENAFIRRFGKATQAHDLDGRLGSRNRALLGASAAVGIIATASLAAGILAGATGGALGPSENACQPSTGCTSYGQSDNTAFMVSGVLGMLLAGAGAGVAGAYYDGTRFDHRLTEPEAERVAERHNVALEAQLRR